jgi:hypothetical protein
MLTIKTKNLCFSSTFDNRRFLSVNTNSSGISLSNSIFTVNSDEVTQVCVIESPTIGRENLILRLNEYLKAITTTFKFQIISSTLISSAVNVVISFFTLFFLTSEFVHYAHKHNIFLNVPTYIFYLLEKVVKEVRTDITDVSSTCGTVSSEFSSPILKEMLFSFSQEEFRRVFMDTPFSSIVSDNRKFDEFDKSFKIYVDRLFKDDREACFNEVVTFYSNFRSSFFKEAPYVQGYLSSSVTNNFGLYRFRNSITNDVYLADATSCKNVNSSTLVSFMAYLKAFCPTFKTSVSGSGDFEVVTNIIPGNIKLSVEGYSRSRSWEHLFSCTVSVVNNTSSNIDGNSPSTGRRNYSTSSKILFNPQNELLKVSNTSNDKRKDFGSLVYSFGSDFIYTEEGCLIRLFSSA